MFITRVFIGVQAWFLCINLCVMFAGVSDCSYNAVFTHWVNVVQGCLCVKVHIRFNRADTRRTDSVFSLLHFCWLACAFLLTHYSDKDKMSWKIVCQTLTLYEAQPLVMQLLNVVKCTVIGTCLNMQLTTLSWHSPNAPGWPPCFHRLVGELCSCTLIQDHLFLNTS